MPVRVFVSHSTKDRALGNAFVQLLRDAFELPSSEIFYSSDHRTGVRDGLVFDEAIVGALREASAVVVLASPNFFESEFCLCELGGVWAVQPEALLPIAVPPLLRDRLSAVLRGRQSRDLLADLDAIQKALEARLGQPAKVPFRDRAQQLSFAARYPAEYPPLHVIDDIHFETHFPDEAGRLVPLDADTIAELKAIANLPDCFDRDSAFAGWDRAVHRVVTSESPPPGCCLKLVLYEGTLRDPTLLLVAQATSFAQARETKASVSLPANPHVFVETDRGWELVPTDPSAQPYSVNWDAAPGLPAPTGELASSIVEGRPSASLINKRLRMLVGAYYPAISGDPNLFVTLNTHRGVKPDGVTRFQLFREPEHHAGGYVRRLFSFPRHASGFETIEDAGFGARRAEPGPELAIDQDFLANWGARLFAGVTEAKPELRAAVAALVSSTSPALQFWVENGRDGHRRAQGQGLRERKLLLFYRRPL